MHATYIMSDYSRQLTHAIKQVNLHELHVLMNQHEAHLDNINAGAIFSQLGKLLIDDNYNSR